MAEKKPKPELPLSLRAGNIQPMEGMAAPKPAEYYVTDCAYIGYPLIRGQRVFVVADGGEVKYQDDIEVIPAPDPKINEAVSALHKEVGAFVLEGVLVYPANSEIESKSDDKTDKIIEGDDDSEYHVAAEVHIHRALYLKQDLRQLSEIYRNMVASTLVKFMEHKNIRIVDAIMSEKDKQILAHGPALWFLREALYRPGLDEKRQPVVYNSLF